MILSRALSVLLIATLCFSLLAPRLIAADIRVSSGEHEDFSRLVVRFADRVDWQIGEVEGGFEFRVTLEDTSFNTARIFQLIPRTRISNVQDLGDGRLFLAVDCDCYADAFDLRGGEVVLDIKDGPPTGSSQVYNQSLPEMLGADKGTASTQASILENATISAQNASVLSLGSAQIPTIQMDNPSRNTETSTLPGLARQGLPLFLPSLIPEKTNPPSQQVEAPDHGSASVQPLIEDTENSSDRHLPLPAENQRVADTEATLLEQIGRAAAQGLLDANMTETEDLIQKANNPLGTSSAAMNDEGNSQSAMASDAISGVDAHYTIQTAIDRDAMSLSRLAGTTMNGETCLDDRYFDIKTWGGDIENGAIVGEFRTRLLGEFDVANPDAVLALAQYYLYLTFGAESAALIEFYVPEIEQKPIMLAMAEIMDFQWSYSNEDLSPYLTCNGKVALWATLAQKNLQHGQAINSQAIAAAFSELPIHLRRHLGPKLATKLISAGYEDTATTLQNAISRAPGGATSGTTYIYAQMAMSEGLSDAAIDALSDVVTDDGDLAPTAIVELIEYKIEHDIEITEREIANAASHAFEQRGTEIGQELARAEVAALAATARFTEAFDRFETYLAGGDIKSSRADKLLEDVIGNLIVDGSDAVFLRYLVGLSSDIHLTSEARIAAVERLVALGFYGDARHLLGRSAQVPTPPERLLFARISLAEGKNDTALGYLAGLEDAPALILRAQALQGNQQFSEAAKVFERANDLENSLTAAWQAGDWARVAEMNQGAVGKASQLMIAASAVASEPPENLRPLNRGAALVDQSQETRATISELLDTFSLPD